MTWVKGQDFGFKVGQRAWHSRFGWGTLTNEWSRMSSTHPFKWVCDCQKKFEFVMIDGCLTKEDLTPSLFHVEQTFDYGRPKWQPEPGELCWVWNAGEQAPCVRNFVTVIGGRNHFKSVNGGAITIHWIHCAPFNGGKLPDEFKHLEGGSK